MTVRLHLREPKGRTLILSGVDHLYSNGFMLGASWKDVDAARTLCWGTDIERQKNVAEIELDDAPGKLP